MRLAVIESFLIRPAREGTWSKASEVVKENNAHPSEPGVLIELGSSDRYYKNGIRTFAGNLKDIYDILWVTQLVETTIGIPLFQIVEVQRVHEFLTCLLYTSDAADDLLCVD